MRRRRAILMFVLAVAASVAASFMIVATSEELSRKYTTHHGPEIPSDAVKALETLEVKGRAPKTGYTRDEFGGGWAKVNGCSVRQVILYRDLHDVKMKDECTVATGAFDDPYTGETIRYSSIRPAEVQIDHIVALSDAWQKGAQQLTKEERVALANDPLELIASDGPANQQKGDADAASWLPANKAFRCEYVARQIAVKKQYRLWVTLAEKDAMMRVLKLCPS